MAVSAEHKDYLLQRKERTKQGIQRLSLFLFVSHQNDASGDVACALEHAQFLKGCMALSTLRAEFQNLMLHTWNRQCSRLKSVCSTSMTLQHSLLFMTYDTASTSALQMQSSERGAFASPISFPDGPNISSHPSVREALPFGIVDLPIEGEGLPIQSSSSPTAAPTEEAPQPFGSPSVPLPDAAQTTQTTTAAFSKQATSDIAPMSTWDQLWDEGSSDVPDQAASESPPAESAGQSASTQQAASFDQEAVTLAGFQQDSASHQVAQSHNDAAQAFQELLQSAELPAKTASSGRQSPTQPSSDQATPSGSARTPAHHASTSSQPQETLPEQASPSLLISSWPDQATTSGPYTSSPDQATPCMPKASAVRGTGAGVTPKTARSKEYGSWWTPPLPRGLSPAWMKVKTPAWVKKMRQLDSVSAVSCTIPTAWIACPIYTLYVSSMNFIIITTTSMVSVFKILSRM